ncbi:hypothetical protein LEN26_007284 [Aphanomyces euteiches]|nr:hypothetical protein AeMF1_001055 [Aphanomyces euteiches]KAH9132871.1 hypothetical protein LEN26_007284 [Aphanomyces euteiches]KAH9188051.1 hypothetical protein AeNC1_009973 [Aphanomyces euteiches]
MLYPACGNYPPTSKNMPYHPKGMKKKMHYLGHYVYPSLRGGEESYCFTRDEFCSEDLIWRYRHFNQAKKNNPRLTYKKFMTLPTYCDLAQVHHISMHRTSPSGGTEYLVHWSHPELRNGQKCLWMPEDELEEAATAKARYTVFREHKESNPSCTLTFDEWMSKDIRNRMMIGDNETMSCVWDAIINASKLLLPASSISKSEIYESFFPKNDLDVVNGIPRKMMKAFMIHVRQHGIPFCLSTYDRDLFPKPRPPKKFLHMTLANKLLKFTTQSSVFMLVTTDGFVAHCHIAHQDKTITSFLDGNTNGGWNELEGFSQALCLRQLVLSVPKPNRRTKKRKRISKGKEHP